MSRGEGRRRAAEQRFRLTIRGNIPKAARTCVGVSSQKGGPKIGVGAGEYLHNLIFPLPFLFFHLGCCSFPHPASPLQPYLWIFYAISIIYLLRHTMLIPSLVFLWSVSPSPSLSDCLYIPTRHRHAWDSCSLVAGLLHQLCKSGAEPS